MKSIAKRSLLKAMGAVATAGASTRVLAQASTPAPAARPQFAPPPKAGEKVFRYAFLIAETGFDPAQVSDLYSNHVNANMFEGLMEYEHLQHAVVRPLTCEAMPEITNDFKTFTFRIKPGIFFTDDAAFMGKKRELTARDFVYSFKRFYDPTVKSPNLYQLENSKLVGLTELRKQVMADKKPFPYDVEVDGVKALDKYTLQFNLAESNPRFATVTLSQGSPFVAMAREVVEMYGDKIMEHPVGTGPFRLSAWKRSSKIVLERNPNYRRPVYDYEAPKGNARYEAIAAKLKGKPMPIVDRVEISIIEESQPRYLAFMNGETDMVEMPGEFVNIAIPNNKLAPNLVKAGIHWERVDNPDVAMSFFNMEHPLVGGYTPEKVALRRAIALAQNETERNRQIYRNQGVIGQGLIPHNTFAFDKDLRTPMSEFSIAKAKALLDTYGYVDKNGDGWREQPDGKPLVIEYASQPDGQSRQMAELWKKYLDSIQIKIEFKIAKWPENLKGSRAGKLMMWGVGWNGGSPDSDTFLALGYGPNKGGANHSRFAFAEYDKLYAQQRTMPDSPERAAILQKCSKMATAYMPMKIHVHRQRSDLVQPRVIGWVKHPFQRDTYKWFDVADGAKA